MDIEKDIKPLAFRYFGGEISRADETQLFNFLKQDKANTILFRQWEKEWIETQAYNFSDKEWESLERRILAIEAVHQNDFTKRNNRWIWLVAAAAVMLVIIGGGAMKYFHDANKLEAHYFTTEAPKGERSKLVLPDGTKVLLNAGSKLNYSNEFNNTNRKVELIGEGYFEVTKKDGNDFTVHTRGYDVVVKGTKFDVAAYPSDSVVTTTLMEGKVELNYGKKIYAMSPGETMSLNVNTGNIRKLSRQPQTNAWVDNRIEYGNITLRQLASILSIQYNVNIHIDNKKLEMKTFNISLRNHESIFEIMSVISELTGAKVSYKSKDIYLD
jgi:transmembrane sensor